MCGGQMNAFSGVIVLLSECFEKLMDGSSWVSEDRSLTWLLIDQPRQCTLFYDFKQDSSPLLPLWLFFMCPAY